MSELSIHIGWEYFLGPIGTLIGIAYYTNGRLTRLETSMEWVKETLRQLTANFKAVPKQLTNAGAAKKTAAKR